MQEGTHTWVQPGLPSKPVLVNHDGKSCPLGRVLKARYVDLSWQYSGRFPQLRDTVFYAEDARRRKKKNLYDSVDLVVDELGKIEDYRGLGFISLGLKITEPEAIRRVQNDEFLTVSVSFQTDAGICSVCHTDWAVDDRCEHRLGEVVDGKPMFLITGRHDYQEVSFVNFPADPFAAVTSKGSLTDSLHSQIFFMGLSAPKRAAVMRLTDSKDPLSSVFESDIEFVDSGEEDKMSKGNATAAEQELDLKAIAAELDSELGKERALQILKDLEDYEPVDGQKRSHKRLLTSAKALVQVQGWDSNAAEDSREAVEAEIETLQDRIQPMSVEARTSYLSQLAERAKKFELTVPNVDPATGKTIEKQIEKQADAPDPAKGEKTEKAGKAESKKVKPLLDRLVEQGLLTAEDAHVGAKALGVFEKLEDIYTQADDDEKSIMRSVMYATAEAWSAGSLAAWYKQRLAPKDEDHVLLSRSEHDCLSESVNKLTEVQKDAEARRKQELSLVKSLRDTRAMALVMFQVLTGAKGFQGLSDEQVKEKVERLSHRSLESLKDSLEDVTDQLSGLKIKETPGQETHEVVREVSDNAQLPSDTPGGDTTDEAEEDIRKRADLISGPRERNAFLDYHLSRLSRNS